MSGLFSSFRAEGENSTPTKEKFREIGVIRRPNDEIQGGIFQPNDSFEDESSDLHAPISITGRTEQDELRNHTHQVAPPLSRLGNVRQFLRNPPSYFEDLQDLETRVVACYPIASKFERLDASGGIRRSVPFISPSVLPPYSDEDWLDYICDKLKQNQQINRGTIQGLLLLCDAGFAGSTYSIIVKDMDRSNVARVISIGVTTLRSVEDLISTALEVADLQLYFNDNGSKLNEALFSLEELSGILLGYLGLVGSETSEADHESESHFKLLDRLTALNLVLLLGLVSYTRSHAGGFDHTIFGERCAAFEIDLDGRLISLSRQRLSCLNEFIQGPVWVFDPCLSFTTGHFYLSSMLADFADLWGPARLIYANEASGDVFETNTLRGSIRASSLPCEEKFQTGEEILCHWRGWSDDYTVDQSLLQAFDHTKPLLIGVSGPHFQQNKACGCEGQIFAASLPRFPLGTTGAIYKDDTRSMTFTAGKYVGVAFGKSQKLHPAITIRNQVIEGWVVYPRPDNSFLPETSYLDWNIGLEISKCTGNARRISLWDIIRCEEVVEYVIRNHAHGVLFRDLCSRRPCCTGLWPAIPAEYREPIRNIIHTLIRRLQNTGISDHDGGLIAWDVSTSAMGVKMQPTWAGMLRDNQCSGTFAVLLNKCLEDKKGGGCAHERKDEMIFTPATVLLTKLVVSVRQEGKPRSPHNSRQSHGWRDKELAIEVAEPPRDVARPQAENPGLDSLTDWRAAEASSKRVAAIDAQIAAIPRPRLIQSRQLKPESRQDRGSGLSAKLTERQLSKNLVVSERIWPLSFGLGKLQLCWEWAKLCGIPLNQTYENTPVRVIWSANGVWDKVDGLYAQADAWLKARINNNLREYYPTAPLTNQMTLTFQESFFPEVTQNMEGREIFVCVC